MRGPIRETERIILKLKLKQMGTFYLNLANEVDKLKLNGEFDNEIFRLVMPELLKEEKKMKEDLASFIIEVLGD